VNNNNPTQWYICHLATQKWKITKVLITFKQQVNEHEIHNRNTNKQLTNISGCNGNKETDGSFGHMMYEKPTRMDVYFQATAPLSVNKACSHDYLF
jgi:hypothetical protein